MTSSPDPKPTSRRSLRRRWRRRIVIGVIALFGLGVVTLGIRGLLPDRADRPAAEKSLAMAQALLKAGNPSAARAAAGDAVAADPNWGEAQVGLARMQLALDDGLGAGASLDRAQAVGYDMRRTRALRARAMMLMGDPKRAAAELAAADPRDAAEADLVRAELATRTGRHGEALSILDRAVAARPADGTAWLALARARRAAADVSGAIAASERAVAAAPRSTDALALRGELVRDQYGLVAALPWFERSLASDPRNHAALIQYAATLGDVGRTRDMLAALRRATQVRKGSAQALYLQAVLAARARKFELARDVLDHTNGAIDGMPGVMLLRGVLDLQAGEQEQAIATLRTLVTRQPMNLTARKLLATAYLRSDASRNAIDVLAPVVARGDADSYALALSARAHERIGAREIAARLLDRAAVPAATESAAFSPDDGLQVLRARAASGPPGERIALIRGLIAAADGPQALAEARALAESNPGVPAAQMLLGDVWMMGKRPADAAAAYASAAALRFDEPAAMRLVEALDLAGKRQEAANALALFLSQNPQNVAALRLSAHWQLAAEDYAAAAATLEELRLRVGDRDAGLLAELTLAHLGLGNDARAAEYAAAAYALQPQSPAVADAYGAALLATGDTGGARDLFRKAALLAPGNPLIAAHLREAEAAG
ncbi:tetratricopeptide repeat protein [Sphingomonas sp. Y38-1Y]|uniref:tetratricopeptide repeat protein n=1 Tax=Sphingomonas sp. Y38-1Y TaxID=3078265 RepID=UPI0028EBA056|nr:tetratricopeptide repeat protein [Sphingomonas sp. Y38-1Y]